MAFRQNQTTTGSNKVWHRNSCPSPGKPKNLIAEKAENYSTSLIVLKNLAVLGLLTELQEEVELVRKERDAFLISDAAPFIQKLINHNNVPLFTKKLATNLITY